MNVKNHFLIGWAVVVYLTFLFAPYDENLNATGIFTICMWIMFGLIGAVFLDVDHAFMYAFSQPKKFVESLRGGIKKLFFDMNHLFFGYEDNKFNFIVYYIYHILFGMFFALATMLLFPTYTIITVVGIVIHLILDVTNFGTGLGTDNGDRPIKKEWGMFLIVCLITLLVFNGLRSVELANTTDLRFYIKQLNTLRETSHLFYIDLPVAYFFAYLSHTFFNDYQISISFTMALFTALSCLLAYVITKKLTGSSVLSMLSAVLVFNPQTVELTEYVVLKNLVGNFFLIFALLSLTSYLNNKKRKWLIALFMFSMISMLTHSICTFSILGVLFAFNVISYAKDRKVTKPVFDAFFMLAMLVLGVIINIGGQSSILLNTFTYAYDFPLLYNAFTSFYLFGSILVFVGVTVANITKKDPQSYFTFSLAVMGLVLHILSFVTPYAVGIRMQNQTYVFYVLCLPYVVHGNKNNWFKVLVVSSYVLPMVLGHFL